MSERTYTESELAAERAALLREAADLIPKCEYSHACRTMNLKFSTYCPNCRLVNAILAIPTDQSALARHDAELQARLERATDLVRYARHFLHNENLISDEEYAAIVQDSEGRVARLEGYDTALARVEAAVRLAEAKCIFTNWNVADRDFQHWLEHHIAALEDRGREVDNDQ